jgi:hypothetical protein
MYYQIPIQFVRDTIQVGLVINTSIHPSNNTKRFPCEYGVDKLG